MATYRENKGSWEIRWSYLGKTYSKGLPIPKTMKAKAEKLAREKAEELDLFLSKLETGLVTIPSDCQDLKLWFFSCGSAGSKTTKVPNDYKLFQMFADFKESLTYQDYKPKTKQVTDIHIRHFTRLMSNKPVAGIGTAEIQSYITKRAKEKTPQGKAVSGDTIRKELGTLSAIWNVAHIAEQVSQTYQKAIKPKGLKLPNVDAKLDWQTIEQVEAQVPLCKNKNELADLWASLFLRIEEEEQLLEDVKNRHGDKWLTSRCRWLDAMVATAIYTGARRSELMRMTVADLDFKKELIRITEYKKANSKTFRYVPMHQKLRKHLEEYLVRENKASGFLFSRLSGASLDEVTVKENLQNALVGTRWENIRGWHLFRHSYISNLACKGVPSAAIEAYAGHLSAKTRKRYQHLFPEFLSAEFSKAFADA